MDKLLKKIGLDDTRHQLKCSKVISKQMFSPKRQAGQSIILNDLTTSKKRVCSCKEENIDNLQAVNSSYKIQCDNLKTQILSKISLIDKSQRFQSNLQNKSVSKLQKDCRQKIINKNSEKKIISSNKKNTHNKKQQTKKQPQQQKIQQDIKLKQNDKIEQILRFLRQRISYKCTLPNHERNKILYVCLQPNCQLRIGCSYCFLHNHQKHLKSQIITCIKDLEQLSFKVNANQQLFSKKTKNFYQQFSLKLDSQLQNIRKEFQINLSFLTMKVKSQFQEYYTQKYLSKSNQKQQKISQFSISEVNNLKINEINLQKTVKFSENQSKKLNTLPESIKQKQILTSLSSLNFEEVYWYLRKRLQILHLQESQSKVLLQFFQQMNSSMTQLFSSFKRNLPKLFIEKIILQKPDIIGSSF